MTEVLYSKMDSWAYAFYKGTSLPMKSDAYPHVQKQAKDLLTMGLRAGVSFMEQAECYRDQLDEMESRMCEAEVRGEDRFKTLSKKEHARWCINIEALLMLKVIFNDDQNGWLFHRR